MGSGHSSSHSHSGWYLPYCGTSGAGSPAALQHLGSGQLSSCQSDGEQPASQPVRSEWPIQPNSTSLPPERPTSRVAPGLGAAATHNGWLIAMLLAWGSAHATWSAHAPLPGPASRGASTRGRSRWTIFFVVQHGESVTWANGVRRPRLSSETTARRALGARSVD